jgi:hypothetical protein
VPKVWCRPLEFDPNLCLAGQLLILEYDATFLLFSTERVLQNKPLVRRYVGCQTDQCAMSTYHQGVRPLKEAWPVFWASVNENRNDQHYPLAASPFHPLSGLTGLWFSELR